MKIYIASGLQNYKQVQALRDALLADGHEITYDWTLHGSAHGQGEQRLREVAAKEMVGVMTADLVIVLLPGGRGTHAELGAANALYKPVILFSRDEKDFDADEMTCAFYWNLNVDHFFAKEEPLDVIPQYLINALYCNKDAKRTARKPFIAYHMKNIATGGMHADKGDTL